MVGFTPSLATAVWVGTTRGDKPLQNKSGGPVWGSTLPSDIWKSTMDNALEGTNKETFPKPTEIGGYAGVPAAPPPPPPPPAAPPEPVPGEMVQPTVEIAPGITVPIGPPTMVPGPPPPEDPGAQGTAARPAAAVIVRLPHATMRPCRWPPVTY